MKEKPRAARHERQKNTAFPIAAIGASAGGLEAFINLLKHLQKDSGVAYIFISHLDPSHKSLMAELLARKTPMPVCEAGNSMTVSPNHIYVIPPNKYMSLVKGKLKLVPRASFDGQYMPIDYFMRSLAQDQKNRSIGVVLSGTASDGALGLQEIREADGVTFVQDPQSAQYAGMPKSALSAGTVDYTLSLSKIAKELIRLGKHPYTQTGSHQDPDQNVDQKLNKDTLENLHQHGEVSTKSSLLEAGFVAGEMDLERIFSMLRKETGVDFTDYKRSTIFRRLSRRMTLLGKNSVSEYVAYLEKDRDEVANLHHDFLITVTKFFRDTNLFKELKGKVFPALVKGRMRGDAIRIWIAGCSGGEEVYSIAIILLEFFEKKGLTFPIQIFATDLSEHEIARARTGRYIENIALDVSSTRLKRFFIKENSHYRIQKYIRDMCLFAKHDLTISPPFSNMDMIACRNVLIYMEQALQNKIIPVFHFALKPGGFLVLGASETIGKHDTLFLALDNKNRIYSKKATSRRMHMELAARRFEVGAGDKKESPTAGIETHRDKVSDMQKEVDRILLAEHTPAGVLINDDMEIVQFRGHTGQFLEPSHGTASFNLLKMAKEGLGFELRRAIVKAGKQGVSVTSTGIEIQEKTGAIEVTFEVIPMNSPSSKERHFLILFKSFEREFDKSALSNATSGKKTAKKSTIADRELIQVRRELHATKEYAQSMAEAQEASSEELKASNEEILSSNEELQSTNEELETAKEELQSTNEELETLNQELITRNTELGDSVDYAQAIVETVREPLLILSGDLKVKSANSSFYKTFKVSQAETEGKILFELGGGQWDIPQLRELLENILPHNNTLNDFVVDHHFPSIGQRIMLLNARRLLRESSKESLILLAIEDITVRKQFETQREDFIAIATHELKTPVTSIKVHTQMLQSRFAKEDDLQSAGQLAQMNAQLDKLIRLIEDLLDVNKIESGKLQFRNMRFDFNDLVSEIVEEMQRTTDRHKIIQVQKKSKIVQGDRDRIGQVIMNFISNAIKYSPRAKNITVSTSAGKETITLFVKDHGVGIAEENQNKVFERFYRGDRAARGTYPGLGLGLYIASEIIKRHGGLIWVESKKGNGSTFCFSLPIQKEKRT